MIRSYVGRRLRYLADRIDRPGAMKLMTTFSFTYERNRGLVFRRDGKGCMLAYMNDAEYDKAWTESDTFS